MNETLDPLSSSRYSCFQVISAIILDRSNGHWMGDLFYLTGQPYPGFLSPLLTARNRTGKCI